MISVTCVLLVFICAVSALPADLDPSSRIQDAGKSVETRDVAARFDPDRQIVYHLFTRENPSVSQPLLYGNEALLGLTNFDVRRRTAVILHGWQDSATSVLSSVLVPAYLTAEDMNVIVVDWSAGANTINFITAIQDTNTAGESVARFLNWLNSAAGLAGDSYHVVGHGLGGHMAGVVGRNLDSDLAYITALEPANPGIFSMDHKLRSTDAVYTEVIHTNAGLLGYLANLGDVDFYPNGGVSMPGCSSQECNHERSIHYFGESLVTGGFKARHCATYVGALSGNCLLLGTLNMGGLTPKTGKSGIYYLTTNAAPSFSQG